MYGIASLADGQVASLIGKGSKEIVQSGSDGVATSIAWLLQLALLYPALMFSYRRKYMCCHAKNASGAILSGAF